MSFVPIGYANLTTPCFEPAGSGGGGGGSNPTFDTVTIAMPATGPIRSSVLGPGYDVYDGAKQIAVLDPSGNLGPVQIGGYLEVQDVDVLTQAQGRMLYESGAIDWEQPLTGTSFYMMTVDKANGKFDLSNIQTINGSPPLSGGGPTGYAVFTVPTGTSFPGADTIVDCPLETLYSSAPDVTLVGTSKLVFGSPNSVYKVEFNSGGSLCDFVSSTLWCEIYDDAGNFVTYSTAAYAANACVGGSSVCYVKTVSAGWWVVVKYRGFPDVVMTEAFKQYISVGVTKISS